MFDLTLLTQLGVVGIFVFIGVGLALLVAHIIALIDSIRDGNWVWFLILLLFPGIGTIIYWLFGNRR